MDLNCGKIKEANFKLSNDTLRLEYEKKKNTLLKSNVDVKLLSFIAVVK